jgi:Tfp pilus assembly protein PilN
MAAGVYTLSALGVCASISAVPSPARGNAAQRVAEVRSRIEASEKQTLAAKAASAKAARAIAARQAVGVHPDWSVLLSSLAALRGETIVLDEVEIRTESPIAGGARQATVRIGGIAPGAAEISGFVLKLEGLGVFDRVSQQEATARQIGSVEALAFRVECRIVEREAGR